MTDAPDWEIGQYVLDRHDRLWHAYSHHFGVLVWCGLRTDEDWTTEQLQQHCGPLRRVQVVEVRG